MSHINLVKFEGTVSRTPDVWDSDPDKMSFMTFSLGINEPGVVTSQPHTGYHRIKGFGKKLTNKAPEMQEGAEVKFYGRLATQSFERNGKMEYITEVIIDPAHFTILKPCTTVADPMADFNQEASDTAIANSRVDQAVHEENRADTEPDADEIPF